jgi:probable biosynthetic protein (TIGR04099 family)
MQQIDDRTDVTLTTAEDIGRPATAPKPIGAAVGDNGGDLSQPITIGMPHLSFGGLSENWLWKECGHRHWRTLAAKLGLAGPDFRDVRGNRLYAAFTAIRLHDGRLAQVREGDALTIASEVDRASHTQHVSSHEIRKGDVPIAGVQMASIFVRRTVEGSNRGVERATANATRIPRINARSRGTGLIALAHQFRSERWKEHLGFVREAGTAFTSFTFRPCPQNDFNGADFLYFASFQSIVDRARWNTGPDREAMTPACHREIYYYANIDIGEHVKVVHCGLKRTRSGSEGMTIARWDRIVRETDQKIIADAFTVKDVARDAR